MPIKRPQKIEEVLVSEKMRQDCRLATIPVKNTMVIKGLLQRLSSLTVILLVTALSAAGSQEDTGYFWHVTDFHVDKKYSAGGSRHLSCHHGANDSSVDNTGPYGDFLCDAPVLLAQSAIEAMEQVKPEVDFILWTGDNMAHGTELTWTDVYSQIHWITTFLRRKMGQNRTIIVPTLGNHDWVPANAVESTNATPYRGFISGAGFNQLLPEEAWGTFERGGYYSLSLSKNIRLVCLNSVLWYTMNKGRRPRSSVDQQLKWLREELNDAQRQGQKVFISGHIGPGFFSRSLPGEAARISFFDDINDGYQDLIGDYKDVVTGQFFGHQHANVFILLSDKAGTPVNSAQLTGSVTPCGSGHPVYKSIAVPVNPSLRLYSYRRSSGELLDYSVYYLDLQNANRAASFQRLPKWERLYSARKDLGVPDLSTASMAELAQRISRSPDLLSRYISYSSSLKDVGLCDGACRRTMLCAILASRRAFHEACLAPETKGHSAHGLPMNDGTEPLPTIRDVIVGLSISVSVVAGIVLLAWAKRARMMQGPRYGRFF
ncbi:acid sphingomyelinase-like phosphodiesterase 3b [Dermacentor silvarum]|uniref:acid sphingomyelinase-like phosphodiesterase 3b n=1 Tax=Dermacentor silvarum TaxID=543639 RepID=UPI00189B918C|nr:acid sphingomyelinase-like phosphodiesterase 3b [Dermacentor silvarum]